MELLFGRRRKDFKAERALREALDLLVDSIGQRLTESSDSVVIACYSKLAASLSSLYGSNVIAKIAVFRVIQPYYATSDLLISEPEVEALKCAYVDLTPLVDTCMALDKMVRPQLSEFP